MINNKRFLNENSKALNTISHLHCKKLDQIIASADEEGHSSFTSVKEFIADLTTSFGDPYTVATAQCKLYQFRQGKWYFSLFLPDSNCIIGRLRYDEKAKHDALEHRMNEELIDAMINVFEDKSMFAKYSALFLTIDNRLKA